MGGDGSEIVRSILKKRAGKALPSTKNNIHPLFLACEKNASLGAIKLLLENSLGLFPKEMADNTPRRGLKRGLTA